MSSVRTKQWNLRYKRWRRSLWWQTQSGSRFLPEVQKPPSQAGCEQVPEWPTETQAPPLTTTWAQTMFWALVHTPVVTTPQTPPSMAILALDYEPWNINKHTHRRTQRMTENLLGIKTTILTPPWASRIKTQSNQLLSSKLKPCLRRGRSYTSKADMLV